MARESSAIYKITVQGEIDSDWSDWLGGLSLQALTAPDGKTLTLLSGPVLDQAALRGILIKIWDLNLNLIAVEKITGSEQERGSDEGADNER